MMRENGAQQGDSWSERMKRVFTKQLRRDGRALFSSGPFETPRKGVVEEAADGMVAQWEKSPAAKVQSSWLQP